MVAQVSSSLIDAFGTFGNLEVLCSIISCSKKRVTFFENLQKQRNPKARVRRLKRWLSFSLVLNTVLLTFEEVIDTLENIKKTEVTDFKVHCKAISLIDFLLSERFILTALTFKKIFDILDPITKIF